MFESFHEYILKAFKMFIIKSKSRNFIITIILVGFLILNIGYAFWKNRLEEIHNQYFTSLVHDNNTYKMQLQESYLIMENCKDSISLSTLVSKHPILILRIPAATCQECTLEELENLKKNFDIDELYNVCAIFTINTPRELKSLTLAFNYKFLKLGITRQNTLNIQEERNNIPYYFIIDSNLQASMFFFPDHRYPESTAAYLKMIKMDYKF
jgi:hypothetical protein